jgi:hypothetical protein
MTGLERNADVVRLASYAPLLANIDHVQWKPDMIWFDNDESWGSTSYQVQKLFMNNVGDRVVPSRSTGKVVQPKPITGAVGLSTWATARPLRRRQGHRAGRHSAVRDDFTGTRRHVDPHRGLVGAVRRRYGRPTPRREHHGEAGAPAWHRLRPHAQGHQAVRREGFLVAFGSRLQQLVLVEPRRLEQHPGRDRKAVGGPKQLMIARREPDQTGQPTTSDPWCAVAP